MTGFGGRHSSPEGPLPRTDGFGFPAPRYEPARYEVPPYVTGGFEPIGRAGTAARPGPGILARHDDVTGPLAEPDWWSYRSSDHPDHPLNARSGDGRAAGRDDLPPTHPSAPLPPRPPGVWDRLRPRPETDDDETVATPLLPGGPLDTPGHGGQTSGPVGASRSSDPEDADDDMTVSHAPQTGEGSDWDDQTGGLEVIGAHVEEDAPRRRGRRGRRSQEGAGDGPPAGSDPAGAGDDALVHDPAFGEDIPVKPYDPRTGRARRRRNPIAVLASLLVLAGIVVGIVLGGQKLIELVDPTAKDYTGQGTGEVSIRVQGGDTLSDIGRTLTEADVVASVAPFVEAAEDNAAAVGIQPGVYTMRLQMSGQAALDRLLDPASRMLSRVTIPEGLTVERTLARIAEETGRPVEEFRAAAADPAALGLPAYANGQLEGFLFPATYDVEPDDAPVDVLRGMVAQFNEVAGRIQLEQRAAAMGRTPLEVVTVASMIQSETRLDEERADVGQVIYNRLDQGIPLGIDATLAYALDKSGNDLTVTDLQTDGPYNTRTRVGLPPTPISSPGEASLEAALAPSTGNLLYYVLESEEGSHFFTSDYAEFQAARQRCADAGLGCGG
ncbi:endolytic transglycosylase MltG [Blastococcus tunisiensis]|uniref:Endolytic murein transglycosylase n=1 Tax=Blastococcus tunisiensis TaxID=1798228 RepID=A0A1I2HJ01_9ACTN|nr:endolytic transglycosylase MltG [Blastococcus sp. DSM 46838]SFF30275.1 UPF0755 protein [Blastococcus sp. DSM 46838]